MRFVQAAVFSLIGSSGFRGPLQKPNIIASSQGPYEPKNRDAFLEFSKLAKQNLQQERSLGASSLLDALDEL